MSQAGVTTPQEKIYLGQGVTVMGVFRDPVTRKELDPGAVTVAFIAPDGTTLIPDVVENPDPGHYRGRVVVTMPGLWYWRMASSAPGEAAKEGWFQVEPSQFDV